jgi:hypothetical protein
MIKDAIANNLKRRSVEAHISTALIPAGKWAVISREP